LGLLDNFNRPNSNTLGSNWSQLLFGGAAIRVNSQQAVANSAGNAYWNVPSSGFGAWQGAAFTFANTPVNNTSLLLKVTGTPVILGVAPSFIAVTYRTTAGGQVVVSTTTNYGLTQTAQATFVGVSIANGDVLSAVADATGTVYVWKTSGVTTTFVGSVTIPGAGFWTGSGRIGLQLPVTARVDNFSGATLP
jgi:hypothetical protein